MSAQVSATDDALEAIEALTLAHGRVMFFQSGGCCDGSSPICLPDGELPISPHDLCSGTWGARPSTSTRTSTSAGTGRRSLWTCRPPRPEGFSLGAGDTHFVTRTASRSG